MPLMRSRLTAVEAGLVPEEVEDVEELREAEEEEVGEEVELEPGSMAEAEGMEAEKMTL